MIVSPLPLPLGAAAVAWQIAGREERIREAAVALGEVAVVLALAEAGHTSPDTILSLWASGQLNRGGYRRTAEGGAA